MLATRYRRKIFRGGVGDYLIRRLKEIGRHYPEIRILEAKTDEDHLHLLVSIPPKMAVSQVVNVIKSNKARA